MDLKKVCSPTLWLLFLVAALCTVVVADKKNAPAQAPSHPSGGGSHPAAPSGPSGGSHQAGPQGNAQHGGSGMGGMNHNAGQQGHGPGGPGGNQNAGMGNRGGAQGQGSHSTAGGNQGANRNGNQAGNQGANHGGNQMGNRGNQPGNHGNQPGNQPGNHNATQGGNRGGNQMANHRQPAGSRTVSLKNGGQATFRKDGKVRSIQTHNMTINHGMRGERHVVAEHNGRRVVSYGRHGGYSQRAYYRHGNRVYVQRTYVVNGRTYAYAYRTYYYGGYPYYGYAPAYYYGPAYYGWAYNPWPQPVYYNWGYAGQPWYGYYGPYYYQPYPAYPYASLWLTDYLIAENLRLAYAAQAAAQQGKIGPPVDRDLSEMVASLWSSDPLVDAGLQAMYGSGAFLLNPSASTKASGTVLTPEVKQAIADQIKKEIDNEKNAAANKDKDNDSGGDQVPAALDPNTRYFVVSSNLDLTTSDGAECELSQGDVIYRTGDTPDDDKMVDATVKASKKDECAVGATVGVDVSDLQDMHNSLRQTMDAGLKELADKSGKNGLPTAPDTKTTAGEVPAPAPDSNVGQDLDQTQKDADQAEAEAQQPN